MITFMGASVGTPSTCRQDRPPSDVTRTPEAAVPTQRIGKFTIGADGTCMRVETGTIRKFAPTFCRIESLVDAAIRARENYGALSSRIDSLDQFIDCVSQNQRSSLALSGG